MTPAASDRDAKHLVPGLKRGLDILRLFRRDRAILYAPEIVRELDIPRATVFRLLHTLEGMGFLVRAEGEREYRLGVAVLSLGFEYLASLEITELARPVLERLRDDSGCSAHLVIRDGRDVVFVARYPSPSAFNSSVNVGTRLPAHATVLGRVFLADLGDDELRALYPEPMLAVHSAQTPRTLDELKTLLTGDRERGHAISHSFFEEGINSVAAPVRDVSRRVAAAINVTAVDGRVDPDAFQGELVRLVTGAAQELSRHLDYRPLRLATAANQ